MARGHASVAEFEARLQQLLDSDQGERALAVAASYAVLVNDDVQAVSAASSAVCVLLWQQVQAWLQLLAYLNFSFFIDVSLYFPLFQCITHGMPLSRSGTSTPPWLPSF
jgi:hypothetical protein